MDRVSERKAVQPVFVKERVRVAAVHLMEWSAKTLYR